jgi:hypothetical protein
MQEGPALGTAPAIGGLAETWKTGERRAIHRRPYIRRKPVPRRPSMLDPHVGSIEDWLAAEPHLTATAVLERLGERLPDVFGDKQLRTVQRLVRAWRARAVRQIIEGVEATIRIEPPAPVPAGTGAQGAEAHDPNPGNICS